MKLRTWKVYKSQENRTIIQTYIFGPEEHLSPKEATSDGKKNYDLSIRLKVMMGIL